MTMWCTIIGRNGTYFKYKTYNTTDILQDLPSGRYHMFANNT